MTTLQILQDRLDLRDLVERYGCCADARDRAGFGDVFASDGCLALGDTSLQGRAAIETAMDFLEQFCERSMHFVGNHQIALDGDRAQGTTYCLAHHVYTRDGVERDTLMAIRYLDEYARTDAGWRISSRVLTVDWQEDRPLTVP